MSVLKALLYVGFGAELTWLWLMGYTQMWGLAAIFGLIPMLSFDLAQWLSPWSKPKEKDPSNY